MSVVYVVQSVQRVSYKTGELEPKYDLTSAKRWGEVRYLIDHTIRSYVPKDVNLAVAQVKEKLADISDKDRLLLLGDPAMIGVAMAVASENLGGRVRVLQWDKRRLDYVDVEVDLIVDRQEWSKIWKR